MSLLAETLIDEWMNRKGFLTMRGVKNQGVDEIDLLGVRKKDGSIEGWHVEAQISFRPVGYISKLTQEHCKEFEKSPTSAWQRPDHVLQSCVQDFVKRKFLSEKKIKVRERVWRGIKPWKMSLIHGEVRNDDRTELRLIEELGIELIPFHCVLTELAQKGGITGAAGTDISEIVGYFAKCLNNKSPRY